MTGQLCAQCSRPLSAVDGPIFHTLFREAGKKRWEWWCTRCGTSTTVDEIGAEMRYGINVYIGGKP